MKCGTVLLVGIAVFTAPCFAAKDVIKGTIKVYDFSMRNVTPSKPIWVAIESYKRDGKITRKPGKAAKCELKKIETPFIRLDVKKPIIKKKFAGKIRVIITLQQPTYKRGGKEVYNNCIFKELIHEFKDEESRASKEWLARNQRLSLNPGSTNLGNYQDTFKNKSFHFDVGVTDGMLDLHPAASTSRIKIPASNITKKDLAIPGVMIDTIKEFAKDAYDEDDEIVVEEIPGAFDIKSIEEIHGAGGGIETEEELPVEHPGEETGTGAEIIEGGAIEE